MKVGTGRRGTVPNLHERSCQRRKDKDRDGWTTTNRRRREDKCPVVTGTSTRLDPRLRRRGQHRVGALGTVNRLETPGVSPEPDILPSLSWIDNPEDSYLFRYVHFMDRVPDRVSSMNFHSKEGKDDQLASILHDPIRFL